MGQHLCSLYLFCLLIDWDLILEASLNKDEYKNTAATCFVSLLSNVRQE